jgi:maleylpyruvate isomerase
VTAFDDDGVYQDLTRQTEALMETVRDLTDADVAAPSALPGWTRGHVLAHVARNADAVNRLVSGAAVGEQRPMYHDSPGRDEEIEAGAYRSVAEQEADVEDSAERLQTAFADFPADRLGFQVKHRTGKEYPASITTWWRWNEVVLHHADLGLGFDFGSLDQALAVRGVEESVTRHAAKPDAPGLTLTATDAGRSWTVGDGSLPVSGPASSLFAWLTGRGDGSDLSIDREGTALPALPAWG